MANYVSRMRTNYFGVTDVEKLRRIVRNCRSECGHELAEKTDPDTGVTKYAVISDGEFDGMKIPGNDCPGTEQGVQDCLKCEINCCNRRTDCVNPLNKSEDCDEDCPCEPDYEQDAFIKAIQEIIEPNDAMIITTTGNEKLCYLTAYAIIVTKDAVKSVDLNGMSLKTAQEMLGNADWETEMEY